MVKRGMKGLNKYVDELLDHRVFNSNSVDAVLQDSSIVVDNESKSMLRAFPDIKSFKFDEIIKERFILHRIVRPLVSENNCFMDNLKSICLFTSSLETHFPISHQPNSKYYFTPKDYFWGGTEEMIITKGSDWCHEIARLFCACTQICGIPSRIVYTFGESDGHVIAEVFTGAKWLLVDPLCNIIYFKDNIVYNCIDIYEDVNIVNMFSGGYYCAPQFFRYLAVADYRLSMSAKYDYRISYCDDYHYNLLSKCWNQN
ncbi:MAG: transglutaminase-like domain-containing protein [Clostridiales bacterium]|jgi:hypothetical protein|nr:transglutaminase-like domain-containing protein [Clostridiales bacterium]